MRTQVLLNSVAEEPTLRLSQKEKFFTTCIDGRFSLRGCFRFPYNDLFNDNHLLGVVAEAAGFCLCGCCCGDSYLYNFCTVVVFTDRHSRLHVSVSKSRCLK